MDSAQQRLSAIPEADRPQVSVGATNAQTPKKITLISTDGLVQHGLRSISAILKREGFNVYTIFLRAEVDAKHVYASPSILASIRDIVRGSLLVGISTNIEHNGPLAIWLFDHLRDMNAVGIWGGIFPTIAPEDCIQHADIVCRGEGELAMVALASKLASGEPVADIANLWVKSNGGIVRNEPGPLIADLDSLPFEDIEPATHYFLDRRARAIRSVIERRPRRNDVLAQVFCVHTSRGCPLVCSYCSNKALDTMYQGRFRVVRRRSIENVIEELKIAVRTVNPKSIWFTDDIFTIRPESELELFSALYKQHINLPFWCYVSPSTVSDPKMRCLVEAGVSWVEMGVQSGSDHVNRDIYGRHQTAEAVLRAARIINKFKARTMPVYQFILFNEYEQEEDVVATINLIKQLPPPYTMQSFALSLFKGSELYARYVKDGYVGPDRRLLTYTEADVALRAGINRMSNRKHYLYTLLWVMIHTSVFRQRIVKVFRYDGWVNAKRIPTIVCYLLAWAVSAIFKVVHFKRWLLGQAG